MTYIMLSFFMFFAVTANFDDDIIKTVHDNWTIFRQTKGLYAARQDNFTEETDIYYAYDYKEDKVFFGGPARVIWLSLECRYPGDTVARLAELSLPCDEPMQEVVFHGEAEQQMR